MEPGLFSEVHWTKTRGNGHNVERERFQLDIRNTFFLFSEGGQILNKCPERLWDIHPWRHSRLDRTQPSVI